MLHGKKLINLAAENVGLSKKELIVLATKEFGRDAKFRTCKVEGLSLEQMLEFFISNGRIDIDTGIKVNACGHCSKS
ncbi:DUF2492 family protein [Paraferrimonas sp. SM1919]|uniref:DUF2492 family protein n=1 Tax=Paraferrimonas sp. SM1919 TaxID=2662263 RepID=UPI0013D7F8E8|nr:DUF2492 family protein [Paraferrimonas sp. SM1919]